MTKDNNAKSFKNKFYSFILNGGHDWSTPRTLYIYKF